MRSLYISQQGCVLKLHQELVQVWQGGHCVAQAQLPFLDQVLIFGQSQVSTPVIRACLRRHIPLVFLSSLGFCHGRLIALERGYRHLSRYQQQLSFIDRLLVARALVAGKVHNGRVLLQRQQRKHPHREVARAITALQGLESELAQGEELSQIMGLEGSAAACYFRAYGLCIRHREFRFERRSRRPPRNPVNAVLSFGYQVLWNHLFSLIEVRGLDPFQGCLHQGSPGHGALASDLIEEFRAPLVDGLVLNLLNQNRLTPDHFVYRDGGCFLNGAGRKVYLGAFLQQMETTVQFDGFRERRWHLLGRQVKRYCEFIYNPVMGYHPYRSR